MEQSPPGKGSADFAVCDFCYSSLDLTYDLVAATREVDTWIEVCPSDDDADSPYRQLYCTSCAEIWKTVNGIKESV